ncbi:MAG: DNA repair and recombination protein RadA [Nanoarchaeota archaeon]
MVTEVQGKDDILMDETMMDAEEEMEGQDQEGGPLDAQENPDEAAKASKKNISESMTVTNLPGVGAATADKLMLAGFDTIMSVAVATPGELVSASGVSETAARKMINSAREKMDMGFESGLEVLKREESKIKIPVGSQMFDELLGGGVETGAITECFGEFGSGKTQIAHVLAVSCQKQDPEAAAVYIDSENTFRPERITQIAEGFGLDPQKVLGNIRVAKAFNSDHQMLLADKVEELIKKQDLNVRIVIVDSLTAYFRAEFVGRGTLAERQQKLNKHLHKLSRLAHQYNLSVYVTNQVMAKPDMFFGDPTAAIGGNIVGHASTFRIYLRKGKKGSRVAKLIDSPSLPEGEATFYVEASGLRDV